MAVPFVVSLPAAKPQLRRLSTEDKVKSAGVRNSELLQLLKCTDSARPALKQQEDFVHNLETALGKNAQEIKRLADIRVHEEEVQHEYHHHIMKRLTAKLSGKAVKEEKEYFETLREERRAEEERKILTEQLETATTERDQLEPVVAENLRIQDELDELYNGIFDGQNVSFPEEDQQEAISTEARKEYERLEFELRREQQVRNLLLDAKPSMVKALDSVEHALEDSKVDKIGGGGLWDFMERRTLDKTDEAVNEVHRLLVQAHQLSPDVQPLGQVEIADGSFMSDVLFDNIFMDHNFHQRIKQSRDELAEAAKTLQANKERSDKRIEGMQADLSKAWQRLQDERQKLQKIREDIFARTLDSQWK